MHACVLQATRKQGLWYDTHTHTIILQRLRKHKHVRVRERWISRAHTQRRSRMCIHTRNTVSICMYIIEVFLWEHTHADRKRGKCSVPLSVTPCNGQPMVARGSFVIPGIYSCRHKNACYHRSCSLKHRADRIQQKPQPPISPPPPRVASPRK